MSRGAVLYTGPSYTGDLNNDQFVIGKIQAIITQNTDPAKLQEAKSAIQATLQDYIEAYKTGFYSLFKADGVARAEKMLTDIAAATTLPEILQIIKGEIGKGVDLISALKACVIGEFFEKSEIAAKQQEKRWSQEYTCNALFNAVTNNAQAQPAVELASINTLVAQ